MGVFARYPDDEVCPSCGRRKVCEVYDGSGGGGKTPLEELGANYEPCQCATCATRGGRPMPTTAKVIATLKDGRAVELASDPPVIPADAVLVEFHDPDGTVERHTRRDLLAAAAAQQGETIVGFGFARYHIRSDRRYHSDDVLPGDLPDGVTATFVPVAGSLPGTQRITAVRFDKALFTRGKAEAWLAQKGLIASRWTESFTEFVVDIYAGEPSGEPRVAAAAEGALPESPLLQRLRALREREKVVRAEIRELAKLMNLSHFEAMQIVLADERYQSLEPEIREKIEDWYTPPTMK